MPRTIAIGKQDFGEVIKENCFYIDKTMFIKEWWENKDDVTLITRPRRFGKTLNMSMLNYFFSVEHKGRGEIFSGLNIWKEEKYRDIQGMYPVIFLSFAAIKDTTYEKSRKHINEVITNLYDRNIFLMESGVLTDNEKDYYKRVNQKMDELDAALAINKMSNFMSRYYGQKVIILLDEYDTPMQEAYVYGYWDKASEFFRSFFNATFKTNPYLERALLIGILFLKWEKFAVQTSNGSALAETMFSDLNNPEVITTTSDKYSSAFGFTENEVFAAMDEYGMDGKEKMKQWYDGFTFGNTTDIYNPWSVINAIEKRKYEPYWVNTSSNKLAGKLLREANADIKNKLESLLKNESIECIIDEEIIYNQLDTDIDAIWSLLLASGYLKVVRVYKDSTGMEEPDMADNVYELRLTNLEIRKMMRTMVKGWFKETKAEYNGFIKALLLDDVDAMNEFMNGIAINSFSSFDTAKNSSMNDAPERFYHGFVLGLIVELAGRYEIKSNRESGFGRYDIMLRPLDTKKDKAYIIEFKVFKPAREKNIEETLKNALIQIEERHYEQELTAAGIPKENIRKYGFAFEGKSVLIG